MEVKLSELKPNPFRNLEKYPLDKEKIQVLKGSIERNDFWDNVVVRKNGNGVELAYGHHRIEAAKEVLGKNKKVNVIVKDLTDEQMLKIMAADNDDAYRMSASFMQETAEALLQLWNITEESIATRGNLMPLYKSIADFLGWSIHRARDVLAQIRAVNEGTVSKEAVDMLPSLRSARVFTAVVQEQEVSPRKQIAIVKKLVKEAKKKKQDVVITRDAVLDAIDPDGTKQRERDRKEYWNFEKYLRTACGRAEGLLSSLQSITTQKQLLDDPEYRELARTFRYSCSQVFKAIETLYKGGVYEKTETQKLLG